MSSNWPRMKHVLLKKLRQLLQILVRVKWHWYIGGITLRHMMNGHQQMRYRIYWKLRNILVLKMDRRWLGVSLLGMLKSLMNGVLRVIIFYILCVICTDIISCV